MRKLTKKPLTKRQHRRVQRWQRQRRRVQRLNFLARNAATPIVIDGTTYRHDEALRPFHRMSDWDPRCLACQQAKTYLGGLTKRSVATAGTVATGMRTTKTIGAR